MRHKLVISTGCHLSEHRSRDTSNCFLSMFSSLDGHLDYLFQHGHLRDNLDNEFFSVCRELISTPVVGE